MIKVVFDTNIYLSGLIFPGKAPAEILKLARLKKIEVFISPFIIEELKKILIFKFNYHEDLAQKLIDEILKFVKVVEPQQNIRIIKEKIDDNHILEAALAAKADYLISGDKKHILPLKKFKSTKIITAREFLDLFHPTS